MWQAKFDSSLNQVYYQSSDGTVSFDLPCEVQNAQAPRKPCGVARPNFLSRITSKLLLSKTRSQENRIETAKKNVEEPKDVALPVAMAPAKANAGFYLSHMPLSMEDSFMLEDPLNLYNSDAESVSSDESVQSFYLELLTNEIYFDYEQSVYYDQKALQYIDEDYDKEKERHELRLQIMKELY